MDIVGLVLVVLGLFALRQNVLVVLGVVTAFAYLVYGDGQVANIVIDAWDALNKESPAAAGRSEQRAETRR